VSNSSGDPSLRVAKSGKIVRDPGLRHLPQHSQGRHPGQTFLKGQRRESVSNSSSDPSLLMSPKAVRL
jgi:hypothetical protein